MTTQHTPGKLRYEPDYDGLLLAENGSVICRLVSEPSAANARRLMACWNMLEGETTESIESNPLPDIFGKLQNYFESIGKNLLIVAAQRDEMLAALRHIEGVAMADEPQDLPGIAQTAKEAIDRAEGASQ